MTAKNKQTKRVEVTAMPVTGQKTLILTMQSSKKGYVIKSAKVLKKTNQHNSRCTKVDPSTITNEIKTKGIIG